MSTQTVLRRSARLAAKQPVVVVVVQEPVAVQLPPPMPMSRSPCQCVNCSRNSASKKIVADIKQYLTNVEEARGRANKLSNTINLFEYIDQNFEYLHSREFIFFANGNGTGFANGNGIGGARFLKTVHEKIIELRKEINAILRDITDSSVVYINGYLIDLCQKTLRLLDKVHVKSHLYGSLHPEMFLLEDPIYKSFVNTYLPTFLKSARV